MTSEALAVHDRLEPAAYLRSLQSAWGDDTSWLYYRPRQTAQLIQMAGLRTVSLHPIGIRSGTMRPHAYLMYSQETADQPVSTQWPHARLMVRAPEGISKDQDARCLQRDFCEALDQAARSHLLQRELDVTTMARLSGPLLAWTLLMANKFSPEVSLAMTVAYLGLESLLFNSGADLLYEEEMDGMGHRWHTGLASEYWRYLRLKTHMLHAQLRQPTIYAK